MPDNHAANLEGQREQWHSVRAVVRALVDGEHVRSVMAPCGELQPGLESGLPARGGVTGLVATGCYHSAAPSEMGRKG